MHRSSLMQALSPLTLHTCLHCQARDTQSGEMMAVKVYNLQALGELNKVQLIREIRLHGSMAHRNIIELYVAFQVRGEAWGCRVPMTLVLTATGHHHATGKSPHV